MKNLGLWLSLLAGVALVGCGDSGGRSPDGGDDEDGGIVLMDSGPETDSGSGGDSGGGGSDSGGGGDCPPATWPAPMADQCASETLTCLMDAGTDAEAQQACIEADPMPDACLGCLNDEVFNCASMNGCDAQVGEIQCCGEDNGCMDSMCLQSNCMSEIDALVSCAQGTVMSGTCGNTMLCFM